MRRPIIALIAAVALAAPGFTTAALAQVPDPPRTPRPERPPKPPDTYKYRYEKREKAAFEETERKSLTVGNVTELDLSNISGDIVISAGGGREATIEYTKRGYGDTAEEARYQLSLVDVSLNVTDGRGEVRSRFKPAERRSPGDRNVRVNRNYRSSIDYRVTAPPQTRIRVKTISGNIQSSRMKGDLSLEAVSGSIRIEGGGRVSTAKTVSGDIEISGVTADEPLVVASMSGTVSLHSIKARDIEVNSVSGDIVAKNVTCLRAELQTLSGDVEYAGAVARSGRYDLKAHSGDVRLAINGDNGFEVEANSFSGRIRSELPIKNLAEDEEERAVAAAGGRPIRGPKRASFRGTYKDGSARIELSTFSGNIVITK